MIHVGKWRHDDIVCSTVCSLLQTQLLQRLISVEFNSISFLQLHLADKVCQISKPCLDKFSFKERGLNERHKNLLLRLWELNTLIVFIQFGKGSGLEERERKTCLKVTKIQLKFMEFGQCPSVIDPVVIFAKYVLTLHSNEYSLKCEKSKTLGCLKSYVQKYFRASERF